MSTETQEQTELTGEQKIMRRYVELGKIISDAKFERDKIKATEIDPMMLEDGISFELGGKVMRFEYQSRGNFDWERAKSAGKIPDDVWDEYSSCSVVRVLSVRNRGDDEAFQAEQQLNEKIAEFIKSEKAKVSA